MIEAFCCHYWWREINNSFLHFLFDLMSTSAFIPANWSFWQPACICAQSKKPWKKIKKSDQLLAQCILKNQQKLSAFRKHITRTCRLCMNRNSSELYAFPLFKDVPCVIWKGSFLSLDWRDDNNACSALGLQRSLEQRALTHLISVGRNDKQQENRGGDKAIEMDWVWQEVFGGVLCSVK